MSIWTLSWADQMSQVRITVDDPSPDRVEITVDFPEPNHQLIQTDQGLQDKWWFPEEQSFAIPGQPELPIISRWVQISETGGVEANIISLEEEEVPAAAFGPVRVSFEDSVHDPYLANDGAFPDWNVRVSEPVIAGGVRLASLSIAPIRYDSQRNVYHVARRIQVSVDNTGGTGSNPLRHHHPIAPAFAELFRGTVLNWVDDANPVHYGDLRGRYLIIALDDFINFLSPLVEWKEEKGYEVLLVPKSQAGSTNSQIKQYIQNVYNSEGPPLEFVLLVGDANQIPPFTITSPAGGEPNVSDHPYSMMEGNDYFSDVFVGRLSTSSINDVRVMVNKVLYYEKTPYTVNTEWFRNATVVAGNYTDQPLIPLSPVQTSMWIQERFLANAFTRVDTFFYWGPGYPMPATVDIRNSISQGVSWVSYRGYAEVHGWQYPWFQLGDIGLLSNGRMLPIVTSIVCRTGDFGNATDPCFGEKWLREGTVLSPKAGVAFIGASDLYTNTRFNNPLAAGFYTGVFDLGYEHLGQALLRGKMEVYNGFPTEQDIGEYCEFYFYVYNLLGDPELSMRTRIPTILSGDHAASVNVGQSFIEVTSRNSGGGIEPYARVTLFKEGETHVSGVTGSDGSITLPTNLVSGDSLAISIHKKNSYPYFQRIPVVTPSAYAGLSSVSYLAGGDDIVSPGENVTLTVTLRNTGTTNLSNVAATLSSDDSYIDLGTTAANFGNINTGASSANSSLTFTVHESAPHNYQAMMTLSVSATGQGPWTHHFWVPVWGSYLRVEDVLISGNGVLDPGETANITFTLYNEGMVATGAFQAGLSSWNNAVSFPTPVANFPNIGVNASATNSNTLQITAPSDVTPGRLAELELAVMVSTDTAQVVRTAITIGAVDTTYPLGSDAYGYWAYDSDDHTHFPSIAPVYNWIELDPEQGGTGGTGHLLGDDESTVVSLPFAFRYYGEDFNEITICSNGWISFGETWMANFRNWHLPSALGPRYLVAGFWDDIRGHPDTSNNPLPREVWTCSDGNQFIIEWSDWYNRYDYNIFVYHHATFEIILVPVTGDDGEIIVQYHTIENVDANSNYGTVGIENGLHTVGLQYTFADLYPPSCSRLRGGLAIKFTTESPDPYLEVVDPPAPLPREIALLPGYPNPFNSQAVFPLELSERVQVELSVYNVMGQKVVDLRNEVMEAGRHQIIWNAEQLPSGIYFVAMSAGSVRQVHKIVLLK